MPRPKQILIFGATSAIAIATAKRLAEEGVACFLCARNRDDLQRLAADLQVRGAPKVHFAAFDALDALTIEAAIQSCLATFPDLDGLLIAHGLLPDQNRCERDPEEMRRAMQINLESVLMILTILAKHFAKQKQGTIAVISSVAGDRGRRSNYVYGSAKAAVSAFLSGLRQRLQKDNVQVLTIKPGFVDTPMTAALPKNALYVGPEVVARAIHHAMGKNRDVVYVPWFWRWIMLVIKALPEWLFKRIRW